MKNMVIFLNLGMISSICMQFYKMIILRLILLLVITL